MSKATVNLTLPIVIEEIESILDAYPFQPYRHVFTTSDLHQELISYTLSRIHNRYTVLETEDISSTPEALPISSAERSQIDTIICQGIQHILYTSAKLISYQIPSNVTTRCFSE